MSIQIQYRRGTAAENDVFTGALAEITVDTTNSTLRVHDGITVGGSNIATVAYVDAELSGISADAISNGTSNVKVLSSNGNIAVTVGGTGILSFTSDGVVNGQANGVGNIGNATTYFNTVFAKATSAQYADVAELYRADRDYRPGVVLEIGGTAEVTETTEIASPRIAGVVSTNPALIMNNRSDAVGMVRVGLLGRVPCLVAGRVRRGDLMCSSATAGHAMAMPADQYRPGAVIGKALEDHDSDGLGQIEVMIGRL